MSSALCPHVWLGAAARRCYYCPFDRRQGIEVRTLASQEHELHDLSPDPAALVDDVRDVEIAMGVVRGMVEMAAGAGVDRADVLRAAGLTPEELNAAEARVPYAKVSRILDTALDVTNDDMLGLRWARALTERTFVPISHLISHTRSLAESFRLLARYYHVLTNRRSFELLADGPTVSLRYVPLVGEPERHRRFAGDMTIGSFFRFVHSFERNAEPGPVSFAHTPRDEAERTAYERFFRTEVRFGCDFTGMAFDRRMLVAPSPQRDDEVRDAMQEVVEQRLVRIDHGTPWAARVRELLLRRGPQQRTDMGSVARAMGTSPRTLRRRLGEEGHTYDRVLEEARHATALRLLQAPDASIQDVAYQLGFSSSSAFHRAFKRWTGTTPKAYREAQLRARK